MKHRVATAVLSLILLAVPFVATGPKASAQIECPPLPTEFGKVTATLTSQNEATYNVWSRIKATEANNDSYYLGLDAECAQNIGDSPLTTGEWTWVQHKDGDAANKATVFLTPGEHTLTLTGRENGLMVDSLLFIQDDCVPVDFGTNCTVGPGDTIQPNISIINPTEGSTVSGTVPVAVDATDNLGVTKVEYTQGGSLVGTSTTPPFNIDWDTSGLENILYVLTAKAYDAAGNAGSASVNVNVYNAPPPPPADTSSPQVAISKPRNGANVALGNVAIKASATDNVGVQALTIKINGEVKSTVNASAISYTWDTRPYRGQTVTISVEATDAANNIGSTTISVKVKNR
jgi:hypothetical protein